MTDIRINVTLYPHVQRGKASGYYVLAERLFPRGAPILVKQQFVGYGGSGGLILTVAHPPQSDTVIKMAVVHPLIGGEPVTWLSTAPLYQLGSGFRMYIAGKVMRPRSAEVGKFLTTGMFRGAGELYWLEIPAVTGDVILGRKEMSDGRWVEQRTRRKSF